MAAAAPLARHDRLAAVWAVDLVSRPRGRRDTVVVGGRRQLLRRPVHAIWHARDFGVRASLVGSRFLLVAGSVQEALLVAEI